MTTERAPADVAAVRQALEHMPSPCFLIGGPEHARTVLYANAAARACAVGETSLESVVDALAIPAAAAAQVLAGLQRGEAALTRWIDEQGAARTARVLPLHAGADAEQVVLLSCHAEPTSPHDVQPSPLAAAQRRLHDWLLRTPVTAASLQGVVEALTERLAELFSVDRASVWLFSDDGTQLRCMDLFERAPRTHSQGDVMHERDHPRAFATLRQSTFVDVHDVGNDPRVAEYGDSYVTPRGIRSMLDAAIRFGGRCFGTLCLEFVERQHHWRRHEIDFACALAGQLAVALESLARGRAEERVQRSEQFAKAVIDGSPIGIQFYRPDGTSLRMNSAMQALLGVPDLETGVGTYNVLQDVIARRNGIAGLFERALAGEVTPIVCREIDFGDASYEQWPLRRRKLWTESIYFPVFDAHGAVEAVVLFVWDVSERVEAQRARERLEAQLAQSQKLEAVGLLAGGVAHDFNNLLTAVIGFADLLRLELDPDDRRRELVDQVRKAADRGATLTRQLLAFARVDLPRIEVFDAAGAIAEMLPMFRRLVEANIQLELQTTRSARIEADRGQFQQILLNLLVNARDAMPKGGSISIEIDLAQLDGSRPAVRLSVSDTGVGMTADVKARLFEPFFTTKPPGRGTGLGLATVYGIVARGGGRIDVYSQPGHGTTFHVLWPTVERRAEARSEAAKETTAARSALVLVVEDDDANLQLAARILSKAGHHVLTAPNGAAALDLARQHEHIDVLLTDVVMPGIGGRELAERLLHDRPELRVVFTSGYTADVVLRHGVQEDLVHFLPKPYDARQLEQAVARALAEP